MQRERKTADPVQYTPISENVQVDSYPADYIEHTRALTFACTCHLRNPVGAPKPCLIRCENDGMNIECVPRMERYGNCFFPGRDCGNRMLTTQREVPTTVFET